MSRDAGHPRGDREPTGELEALVRRAEGPQPWRRLLHAGAGVAVALTLRFSIPSDALALTLLGAALVLILVMEWVRLRSPRANVLFFRIFNRVVAPEEEGRMVSSVWYALGLLVVVAAFPREIAVPAILVVAVADPAASYVGRRWGRRRIGAGTVTGTVTFAVTAFLVLTPLVGPGPATMASAFSAAVEVLPWKLSDNVTVPVSAGLALWLLALA